jgi:hypothetical protein
MSEQHSHQADRTTLPDPASAGACAHHGAPYAQDARIQAPFQHLRVGQKASFAALLSEQEKGAGGWRWAGS